MPTCAATDAGRIRSSASGSEAPRMASKMSMRMDDVSKLAELLAQIDALEREDRRRARNRRKAGKRPTRPQLDASVILVEPPMVC